MRHQGDLSLISQTPLGSFTEKLRAPVALIFTLKSSISYSTMSQYRHAVSNHPASKPPRESKAGRHSPYSPEQTLKKNVKGSHRPALHYYFDRMCHRHTCRPLHPPTLSSWRLLPPARANQGEKIGQIQRVKAPQYYISILRMVSAPIHTRTGFLLRIKAHQHSNPLPLGDALPTRPRYFSH